MTNFIEPYTTNWKTEFDHLKEVLQHALEDLKADIQHVGSTAIPGLVAKPILDIDIIIDNKELLAEISERLEKIGYVNRGEQGISDRFVFRQTSEWVPRTEGNKKWQAHHLYVCFSDSLALKNHLLFRDALLRDPKLLNEYSELKINLTKEKGMARERYTVQKTEFIISVLEAIGLEEEDLIEMRRANL